MKKIIFIPPKPPEPKKLKAAAYCQVSTLSPIPRCSIDWQIKSYIKMIPDPPDLVCAGVFFDADGNNDCIEVFAKLLLI